MFGCMRGGGIKRQECLHRGGCITASSLAGIPVRNIWNEASLPVFQLIAGFPNGCPHIRRRQRHIDSPSATRFVEVMSLIGPSLIPDGTFERSCTPQKLFSRLNGANTARMCMTTIRRRSSLVARAHRLHYSCSISDLQFIFALFRSCQLRRYVRLDYIISSTAHACSTQSTPPLSRLPKPILYLKAGQCKEAYRAMARYMCSTFGLVLPKVNSAEEAGGARKMIHKCGRIVLPSTLVSYRCIAIFRRRSPSPVLVPYRQQNPPPSPPEPCLPLDTSERQLTCNVKQKSNVCTFSVKYINV